MENDEHTSELEDNALNIESTGKKDVENKIIINDAGNFETNNSKEKIINNNQQSAEKDENMKNKSSLLTFNGRVGVTTSDTKTSVSNSFCGKKSNNSTTKDNGDFIEKLEKNVHDLKKMVRKNNENFAVEKKINGAKNNINNILSEINGLEESNPKTVENTESSLLKSEVHKSVEKTLMKDQQPIEHKPSINNNNTQSDIRPVISVTKVSGNMNGNQDAKEYEEKTNLKELLNNTGSNHECKKDESSSTAVISDVDNNLESVFNKVKMQSGRNFLRMNDDEDDNTNSSTISTRTEETTPILNSPLKEDISDEAMRLRHTRALIEERCKFQTYLKYPWSTRSRANRRIDSRTESSGGTTPVPSSPAPQLIGTGVSGGVTDQEVK